MHGNIEDLNNYIETLRDLLTFLLNDLLNSGVHALILACVGALCVRSCVNLDILLRNLSPIAECLNVYKLFQPLPPSNGYRICACALTRAFSSIIFRHG